jgi:hypothetical protein
MLEPHVLASWSGTRVPTAGRDRCGEGVKERPAPGVAHRMALDDEWPRRGTR